MIRIGQLAELARVSIPTIKHYVNEGLIPKPRKTGKTMAYYDKACVDRIKLIKKLQGEKFLPLDVIKRVLDSGSAYKEELELGEAILKSYKLQPEIAPVSQARIERHTGYPLRKIRLLEKAGLVMPSTGGEGKYYDSTDCKIIEIMKRREQLGLPFDHSVETVKLYRDAMEKAVQGDIRLFAKDLLGGFSTEVTLKFLTEVDDSLDSFVVLIRQKMLRSFSQAAIAQINELPEKLALLSVLPIQGKELPDTAPNELPFEVIYHFCKGAYDDVINLTKGLLDGKKKSPYASAAIIANLLKGDSKTAMRIVESHIPRPTYETLENTTAALAALFSIGKASGFSEPFHFARKALAHLMRIEVSRAGDEPMRLFSQYVCGAIYIMLPDIFDTTEDGLRMLLGIEEALKSQKTGTKRLPTWLTRTLENEALPTIEIRVHRFLAEGYLKLGNLNAAQKRLAKVIELADTEDENSKWARLTKVELKLGGLAESAPN
jgi:DNA-binding transcriptional MerR regulator